MFELTFQKSANFLKSIETIELYITFYFFAKLTFVDQNDIQSQILRDKTWNVKLTSNYQLKEYVMCKMALRLKQCIT